MDLEDLDEEDMNWLNIAKASLGAANAVTNAGLGIAAAAGADKKGLGIAKTATSGAFGLANGILGGFGEEEQDESYNFQAAANHFGQKYGRGWE